MEEDICNSSCSRGWGRGTWANMFETNRGITAGPKQPNEASLPPLQDEVPELDEGLIVTIAAVNLVNPNFTAEQPRVQRPRMESAEILIEENDDPRGIFNFHVVRVR